MKKIIFISIWLLSSHLFCQIDDKVLFEKFKETMSIGNEAFVIINVTDLNTNLTKQYCSTNLDLINALEIEFNNSSRKAFKIIRKTKTINFEFKNKKALELFKYAYTTDELNNFNKEVEINKIIPNINSSWRIPLSETEGKTFLYGFSLTKNGLIIGLDYNCFGFDGLWCISCQE